MSWQAPGGQPYNPNAQAYVPQGNNNNYNNMNYNNNNNNAYYPQGGGGGAPAPAGYGGVGGYNPNYNNNNYNPNYNNNNNYNPNYNNNYNYRGNNNNYNNSGYNNYNNNVANNTNNNTAGGYTPSYNNNNNSNNNNNNSNNNNNNTTTTTAAAKTTHADAAKLTLGGGSGASFVPPKRKGGATLSLGKKKEEANTNTNDKKIENEQQQQKETNNNNTENTNTTEEVDNNNNNNNNNVEETTSPTTNNTTTNTTNTTVKRTVGGNVVDTSKMSAEELREHVKKEIAKQRSSDKKSYKRDPRPHFNVVFCGHVDAGKSTISGHLLMEKGLVDQREMEKLKREAEAHHREGWEYAYVMDVSEEERSKGITRETGAAYFETEKRRVTVLDAPGHKAFVPSMIGGATQAEICVLVISSRTGEFETGFEKGGQTREHAMLVRTCGVRQMICVINKMDEMKWSEERYTEIVEKLRPFLRQNGYDETKAKNLVFIPIAGLTGENLIKPTADGVCPWYTGPTLMDVIDNLVLPESKTAEDVFCIPLVGAYKDDGKNYVYGKVESGSIAVGEKLQILPTKQEGVVEAISIEQTEFDKCYPGDNVHLRVRNIDENDVHSGYVATSVPTSLRAVEYFQARVVILDVKNIICAGSRFMLHIHAAQEEASFHKLLAKVDKKTGEVLEKEPACAKAGDVVIARIEIDRPVVVEPHKDFDKMGRFMLRDDGKTIAIGLVMKLYESTRESLAKQQQ